MYSFHFIDNLNIFMCFVNKMFAYIEINVFIPISIRMAELNGATNSHSVCFQNIKYTYIYIYMYVYFM